MKAYLWLNFYEVNLHLFSCKSIFQITGKVFAAAQSLLTDHWQFKTVNRATFRRHSENHLQLYTHLLKTSSTVTVNYWSFQDSLIYLAEFFDQFYFFYLFFIDIVCSFLRFVSLFINFMENMKKLLAQFFIALVKKHD